MPGDGVYAIDSLRVFSLNRPSDSATVLLYKLDADSGDSWNYLGSIIGTVLRVFPGIVFGTSTIIKEIEYRFNGCPDDACWIGTRYLASGFGLVQWDVEPSEVSYLAGAIINTNHYGTIVALTEEKVVPDEFKLDQNFPNPFNGQSFIRYTLRKEEMVSLVVHDILGREIVNLVNEHQAPGEYTVSISSENIPSGVYYCRLSTHSRTTTRAMLIIK